MLQKQCKKKNKEQTLMLRGRIWEQQNLAKSNIELRFAKGGNGAKNGTRDPKSSLCPAHARASDHYRCVSEPPCSATPFPKFRNNWQLSFGRVYWWSDLTQRMNHFSPKGKNASCWIWSYQPRTGGWLRSAQATHLAPRYVSMPAGHFYHPVTPYLIWHLPVRWREGRDKV